MTEEAESGHVPGPPAAYRSPLLALPGAVVGRAPDAGVAAHYGDPGREQRALERGGAVVDLSHLAVVQVSGPDRLSWLHSLATQWLTGLGPGESREVLLLDPHGRVEHAFALVDDGERAWLVTETAAAAPLVEFLTRMRFMLRVEVADRSADWAVLGSARTGLDALWSAAGAVVGNGLGPVWRDPWPGVAEGGAAYGPPEAEHPGAEVRFAYLLVPRASLRAVASQLAADGVALAGASAWEALRVAAWRPRLAREVDERTVPHELDWLRTAVHLQKGCYRGQETVARVVNLGRPPRRLVFLHLDGSGHLLPEPGAAVFAEDRPVGRVTSVVRHHEAGPVALAVIKRSVPVAAALEVEGPDAEPIAAAQEEIVTAAGVSDARPSDRGDLPHIRPLRRPGHD